MNRTHSLLAVLATVFAVTLGAQVFDPNSPEVGYPKQPEAPADGHGVNSPSRRATGPLIYRQYVNRTEYPPAHGYVIADFETANGHVDSFRYRLVARVIDKDGTTELVHRDVKRIDGGREVDVVDFEVTMQVEDGATEVPASVTFDVLWRETVFTK